MNAIIRKRTLVLLVLVTLVSVASVGLAPSLAEASHFRFGTLNWQPTGNPLEVEFRMTQAWRRSAFFGGSGADGFPIPGDIITSAGLGTFTFGDGTTESVRLRVTSHSVTEDWIIGEFVKADNTAGVLHTYAHAGPFTAGFFDPGGCCRVGTTLLNNRPDGFWRLETSVSLSSGNSSPVSNQVPIVIVPASATATFSVPATDPNSDTLRWRLSTEAEAGGGLHPTNLTGSSVDSSTGVVTWNTVGLDQTKFWTTQIVVEDLDGSGNVKTKTPVDFLLKIVPQVATIPTCSITPPGPLSASAGSPVSFTVTGTDPDAGDTVTLNVSGLPVGATMTPALPVTGASPVSSTFNWTPSATDVGSRVVTYSATDSAGQQGTCSITLTTAPLDTDGDGVPDNSDLNNDGTIEPPGQPNPQGQVEQDNCPATYNPDQADLDGDGVGDACDNCPKHANTGQEDDDRDGDGNLCDNEETLGGTGTTTRPGEPKWVTATFKYLGQDFNGDGVLDPITTPKPTCFITTFTVMLGSTILPPIYLEGPAIGFPTDWIVFQPGQSVTVMCDLNEHFNPSVLTSGPGGAAVEYTVQATYSNDIIPATPPTPPPFVFIGTVSSVTGTITIQGTPVNQFAATISYNPATWVSQWVTTGGAPIAAQISVPGRNVADIDPATILLNGTVPIIVGSNSIAGGVLTVKFPRGAAVASLGTLIPGPYFPTVQGEFTNGDVFSGQGPITLVNATVVPIDIMPGTFPNRINLGAKGALPVAILSTATFDATTVDPATVTLEGAPVSTKKGGTPQFSIKDVNGDGRQDMLLHFDNQALQLTSTSTQATLDGLTVTGAAIVGTDAVVIVK